MTLTQPELRHHVWTRLRRARPDLAPPPGRDDMAALLAARERILAEEDAEAPLAVAVVRHFEAAGWIRETCRFALGLAPETAAAWRRAVTRTVFLAGNPRNLDARFAFDHVAEDGSSAWYGPAPARASAGIRRMLKLFRAPAPLPAALPSTVRIPGAGRPARPSIHRDLHVVTVGVQVHEVLVHLHHLLAEAAMDGLLAAGDRLTLRPVPCLIGVDTPFAAIRADIDPAAPDRLRAFAALTEQIRETEPAIEERQYAGVRVRS